MTRTMKGPLLMQLCSSVVTNTIAFTPAIVRPRKMGDRTALATLPDEDIFTLMDESVMLFSKIPSSVDNQDLQKLREREVTMLVEDIAKVAYAAGGGGEKSVPKIEAKKAQTMPSGDLAEISRQLDKAILQGYQSTFSEKQLEVWVEKIEGLQEKYEQLLAGSETTLVVSSPEHAKDSVAPLQTRLEQLQTLISPASLPAKKSSEKIDTPTRVVATKTASPPLVETPVVPDISLPESSTLEIVDVEVTPRAVEDVEATPLTTEEEEATPLIVEDVEATPVETEGVEATQFVEEEIPGLPTEYATDKVEEKQEEPISATYVRDQGPDALSAFISAAAIGAVAVTKEPAFAAGIALGPIVKASIENAKAALKTRQAAAEIKRAKREASKAAKAQKDGGTAKV